MLCSNCSQEVKPIVALDIDGTLADYHGHFLRFAASYLEADPTELLLKMSVRPYNGIVDFRDYCRVSLGITTETFRAIKLAFRQGGQKRTMPILFGAQALAGAIKDAGAELWITTTRPYLSLDTVLPDTVEWLRRHEIEWDHMIFDDDKYEKLAEQVDRDRVVAIFDDIPELVDAANVLFPGRGWLVKGAYNRGTISRYTSDLDSAADIAVAAIKTWREQHG